MLLYQYAVMSHIEEYRKAATRFRDRWKEEAPAPELLRDLELLDAAFERLQSALPRGFQMGEAGRHIGWCMKFLKQNNVLSCGNDPESLCSIDAHQIEEAFRAWCLEGSRLDPALAAELLPLLERMELDSAVRKAFVLLKARMVEVSGIGSSLDGLDLVNALFGAKGVYAAGSLESWRREGLRNLFDGLYKLFRNTHMHNHLQTEFHEADTVITAVNWAMFELEKLRELPAGAARGAGVAQDGGA